MTTRTIIGPLLHPGSDAVWASGLISFKLRAPFVSSGATYPTETVEATTDVNGQFSVDLAVPSSGTVQYVVTLPDSRQLGIHLSAGAPTTLHALLAIAQTNTPASALQTAIDAMTLIGLSDTPDSYSGQTGKVVAVNAAEDGVEFVDQTGGGGGGGARERGHAGGSGVARRTLWNSACRNRRIVPEPYTARFLGQRGIVERGPQ